MRARYGNAEPGDLGDYRLPALLKGAAGAALQAIRQASSLAQIREQLTREADRQHGRVWPA